MIIIETPIFTKQIQSLISDEEYQSLQKQLIIKPDLGKIISGSGGLRKIRWSIKGRGKRGGIRVIYYWFVSLEKILMLFVYPKSEQEDLTPEQLKILKRIVEKEYK
jgi:mRNA-degrading endonuclease RelE of RelBE toxin-antitoxin system